ncbi:unnamed protein product [Blepharisma stoltei]|uniref:Uncharacterized protein n=1 Tax=Blepharisma stoltei TaxID=1481888 RepID=A0AAU9ISM5_9CILI|nr:unnamed protein product [Blepharisma stoltei]
MKNKAIMPTLKTNFSIRKSNLKGIKLDWEEMISPGSSKRKITSNQSLIHANSQKRTNKSTKESDSLLSPYGFPVTPYSSQPKSLQSFSPKKVSERAISVHKEDLTYISKSRIERIHNDNSSIDNLSYCITKAKSDKLELIRDIATYESLFSEKKCLKSSLKELYSSSQQIKSSFDNFLQLEKNSKNLKNNLNTAIESIMAMDWELEKLDTSKTPINIHRKESSFGARIYTQNVRKDNSKLIYAGISTISCLNCLLKIECNANNYELLATAQLLCGKTISNCIDLNTNISRKIFNSQVKELISHFWLNLNTPEETLNFDWNCSKKFLALTINLKGSKKPYHTLILKEDSGNVELSMPNTFFKVNFKIGEISDKHSLFSENPANLAKRIQAKLYHNNRSFFWIDNPIKENVFSFKEKESDWLDDVYLSKTFKELQIKKSTVSKVRCGGRVYKFEILIDGDSEIIKIYSATNAVTIPWGSNEYKLLSALQFPQLIYYPLTLSKSLELPLVLKHLFTLSSHE